MESAFKKENTTLSFFDKKIQKIQDQLIQFLGDESEVKIRFRKDEQLYYVTIESINPSLRSFKKGPHLIPTLIAAKKSLMRKSREKKLKDFSIFKRNRKKMKEIFI